MESYALLSIFFSDSFHYLFFPGKKKKAKKVHLTLMSLLLTPKFSLCLQNRLRVTMPAGQTSLTVQCIFLPSLKPADSQ